MMGTGYGATRDTVLRGLFAGIQCKNVRIQDEDGEWRSSVRQGEAATACCLGGCFPWPPPVKIRRNHSLISKSHILLPVISFSSKVEYPFFGRNEIYMNSYKFSSKCKELMGFS